VGMCFVPYPLNQNAWSRTMRRRFATSISLLLLRGSVPSSDLTCPRPLPKCSCQGPIGPSHRLKRNSTCSISRGGARRGWWRLLPANGRKPKRSCSDDPYPHRCHGRYHGTGRQLLSGPRRFSLGEHLPQACEEMVNHGCTPALYQGLRSRIIQTEWCQRLGHGDRRHPNNSMILRRCRSSRTHLKRQACRHCQNNCRTG
jgi:hypothetical protein